MTTEVDLTIDQGVGFAITFVYCKAVPGSNPPAPDPTQPVDVTGWTAHMQIRPGYEGPVLVDLTDTSGIAVGGADGFFTVTVTGQEAAQLTEGIYDLLATPPSGQPEKVAAGAVHVNRTVTGSPPG